MDDRTHGSPILVPIDGESKSLQRVKADKSSDESYYESWLQQLVDKFPHCLPFGEIEPGLTEDFVSVCMELPTRNGFVDNLLMTPAGDIAIVETKLWRNPEAGTVRLKFWAFFNRLMVVGNCRFSARFVGSLESHFQPNWR